MTLAGREIRLALKRIYGTPEAAEKTIRELAQDTQALEQWATIVTARAERFDGLAVSSGGEPFSFDDMPPTLREGAVLSMAAAMLVWTEEQESGAA
jgi:hypothetical protein